MEYPAGLLYPASVHTLTGPSLAPAPLSSILRDGLCAVENRMALHLSSDLGEVAALCRYVERYRGKMLRPTLVIACGLACGACDGRAEMAVSDRHITIGAVLEIIHLATLVHDDILDDAETRRGAPTVSAMRGNETAVILGDYLIARAFHLCSTLDSQAAALRVGEITSIVCEGEMLQLARRGQLSLDEKTYFEIIERKTAALIAVACELGASFAGADRELSRRFYSFGRNLGIAFQIIDDLLDLVGSETVVGKSLGRDLEKGKITLPLIHHFAGVTPPERDRMADVIRSLAAAESHEAVAAARADIAAALERSGAISKARGVASGLVAEAKALLAPVPPGPARDFLAALADAVIQREF